MAVESKLGKTTGADFRSSVPITLFYNQGKAIDHAIDMAQYVEKYWQSRGVPSQASRELQEISTVMRKRVPRFAKRDAVSVILGFRQKEGVFARIAMRLGGILSEQ